MSKRGKDLCIMQKLKKIVERIDLKECSTLCDINSEWTYFEANGFMLKRDMEMLQKTIKEAKNRGE